MLISPNSPTTAYLATRVEVIDSKTKQVINNVFSFDTKTKEAEVFVLTPSGDVAVKNGKAVTEKVNQPHWEVYDKFTKKLITDETLGTVSK